MRKFAVVFDYEEPFRPQDARSNDTVMFTVENNWSDATLQSIIIKAKSQAIRERLKGEECLRRTIQIFCDQTNADWDFVHAKAWITIPSDDLEEEES